MGRVPASSRREAQDLEREAMKAAFLRMLSLGQSAAAACRHLGVGRRTVYRWHAADADFAQSWKVSLLVGRTAKARATWTGTAAG